MDLMRYGQYREVYAVLATFMKRRKQMIRARAINKVYETRCGVQTKNVIGYTLEDEQGNLLDVHKERLKEAIRQGKIEVINITLTSDDRLVFKSIDKISEKRVNKFKSTITEEMKQQADTYEALTNMIYSDVICECRPSEKGMILYRVKQRTWGKKSFMGDAIEFAMPPEVKVVYNNAFENTIIMQEKDGEPLDYSNVEYIGDYGIPHSKESKGTRVKFGKKLKYLGYHGYMNIIADYLMIDNNLRIYKNRLPHLISIGKLDITREDCSDIDIATYGNIGKLNISNTVKKMKQRIEDDIQEMKVVSEKLYVEELYISNESGITKHNSFRYTNLDPTNVSGFKLKVLNVPEEIFDDIVTDSLKNLRYDIDTKFILERVYSRRVTDSEAIDKIIDNIKQIARAYKVGTGRDLTDHQKKKFMQVINRFEQYKTKFSNQVER